MRGTIDLGIRGAAISLLLIAATACSNGSEGNGGVDGDAAPTVTITAPADGATFASGAAITFTGSANDAEDGDITADLAWTSDLDGAIGTGGDVTATLSDGTHAVAASVTDSAGQSASASVDITVGDGEGGGGGTSGTRDVGFVTVDEVEEVDGVSQPTVAVSGGGAFLRFDADVPDAFFTDPWADLVGTCEVTTATVTNPLEGLPVPDIGLTFLEAGATVDVTSSGAPYLELDRSEFPLQGDTYIGYGTAEATAGLLEADLAIDVPGDEFPTVTNATIPEVASFALTTPANPGAAGSVEIDTIFAWSGASGDASTFVMIDITSSDPFDTTDVTCYAPDIGSFALPDATKTELGAAFSGSVREAGRERFRVETVGDARLILRVSRGQSFVP